MINDYSLFYSYKNIGDVLIIFFDDEKIVTSYKRNGNVVSIYNGDELVGINIFDISKIVKIKYTGMLYAPSQMFIDVVNTLLINAGLDTLAYREKSGYVVGAIRDGFEIENGYLYMIDIGNELVSGFSKKLLECGNKVVVATLNTRLSNTKVVHERVVSSGIINAHICSLKDLDIEEDNNPLIVEDDIEIGNDFFVSEVK